MPNSQVLTKADQSNYSPDTQCISVHNVQDGEVLPYPLVLMKGSVYPQKQTAPRCRLKVNIRMHQYSNNNRKPLVSDWQVINFEFKCLAYLSTGNNCIILDFCGTTTEFVVIYQPMSSPYHVLPVYIICEGHDGKFQAPTSEDNSVESACKRIALGTRLIQCLMAEKIMEAGFKRKSFQLAYDVNPLIPECVVFHSQLNVQEARKMKEDELWKCFGRELISSSLASDDRKFLAFLSCTHYSPRFMNSLPKTHDDFVSQTEAYVALGGGGLALFGTACLHTWPLRVEEIIPRFLNHSKVDTQYFMDDSCYRGTLGGCFATTLGSVCHELGHTFNLGHSSEGIMARGFDHVDKVFTIHSQVSNSNKDNGSHSARGSVRGPVCGDLPSHSTVCFSRILNVSYNIGFSPEPNTSHSCCERTQKAGNNRHKKVEEMENNIVQSMSHVNLKSSNDCTYWTKSCAALLNHHRWFNNICPNKEEPGHITFDPLRKAVVSDHPIQVIEVRNESGLILASWEYMNTEGVKCFPLPTEFNLEDNHLLVVEDSLGNIFQHQIS